MGMAKNLRRAMARKGIKTSQLADMIGKDKGQLSVLLWRDRLNYVGMEQMARALNCEIVLMDKDTGELY